MKRITERTAQWKEDACLTTDKILLNNANSVSKQDKISINWAECNNFKEILMSLNKIESCITHFHSTSLAQQI